MENSALPTDLFDLLIDYADCPMINGIARTCLHLAALVRERATELADTHMIYGMGNCLLPNGTNHSVSKIRIKSGGKIAITYDRGMPTHWCRINVMGSIWGCRDSPYTIECTTKGAAIHAYNCMVRAEFTDGIICATPNNIVTYGTAGTHDKLTRVRRSTNLVGFLVDGRMCAHVVNAWMDNVIKRVTAANPDRFSTPSPRVLIVGGAALKVMSQFSAIEARRK